MGVLQVTVLAYLTLYWMKNRLLDLVEVAWLSFLMGWVDVFSLDVCGLGFLVC